MWRRPRHCEREAVRCGCSGWFCGAHSAVPCSEQAQHCVAFGVSSHKSSSQSIAGCDHCNSAHRGRPHLDRMDCLYFQACAAAQLRRRDGGSGALRDGRQPDAPAQLGQSACQFQPEPCRVSDSARTISTFCVRRCWTVRVRLHWVWLRLQLRRQSGLRSEETKGIQAGEVVSLARAGLRSAASGPSCGK